MLKQAVFGAQASYHLPSTATPPPYPSRTKGHNSTYSTFIKMKDLPPPATYTVCVNPYLTHSYL